MEDTIFTFFTFEQTFAHCFSVFLIEFEQVLQMRTEDASDMNNGT